MKNASLLQQNTNLANASAYKQALKINVLSSMAIEGVKKAAEKALNPTTIKPTKR